MVKRLNTQPVGEAGGLEEFEKQLAALVGRPTQLRPFVCDGSPLECRVFIVGLNPASPMQNGFWDFWRPDMGFDKSTWFEAYKAERAARPLKPGRTRRHAISTSRRVIGWISSELGPVKSLETNIYAAATEEIRDLTLECRVTAPFDFLLETIAPSVVVVHGKDAIDHLRHKSLAAKVIEVDHFSRGWSEQKARELGQEIRRCIGG